VTKSEDVKSQRSDVVAESENVGHESMTVVAVAVHLNCASQLGSKQRQNLTRKY